MNYYNENDPGAAAWLRELIAEGLIPAGEVDDRNILEVKAHEINGFTQWHFFAGIGGWPLALDLAGWPDNVPVVTGSCPCQPFSVAGKRRGKADERHLWPAMFGLVRELGIATVFGEQVAGSDGFEWFAGVRADMEGASYAVGAADLPAACVGAPHIRQRLYWGAQRMEYATCNGREQWRPESGGRGFKRGCGIGGMVNSDIQRCESERLHLCERRPQQTMSETAGAGEAHPWSGQWIHCRDNKLRRIPLEPALFPLAHGLFPERVGLLRGAGNAIVPQVAAEFVRCFMDSAGNA